MRFCDTHLEADPGYTKNAESGLHRELNKLFCPQIINPKKARVLSVLPTVVGMASHPEVFSKYSSCLL